MARPRKDIDAEQVQKLASLGLKNTEIADFFAVDEGTIRKRFSERLTKGRTLRKAKLRELQWRAAEGGNIAMLIFLGKNELGQSDKQEVNQSIAVTGNFDRLFSDVFGAGSTPDAPVSEGVAGR